MAARGVKMIIFSVSTHEFCAKVRKADPARFGFFAMSPDPTIDVKATLEEIQHNLEICLFTLYGKGDEYLHISAALAVWIP